MASGIVSDGGCVPYGQQVPCNERGSLSWLRCGLTDGEESRVKKAWKESGKPEQQVGATRENPQGTGAHDFGRDGNPQVYKRVHSLKQADVLVQGT
jgi:hypothetical protein